MTIGVHENFCESTQIANSQFFMVYLQLAKQDWVRKSAEGLQIYFSKSMQVCGFAICGSYLRTAHLRKIRLIESNAKCRYLNKLTCKRTLLQVFYLSEAPFPSYDPILPPPYTMHKIAHIRVYSKVFTKGRGGGRVYQREGKRGNASQSWSKIPK